MKLTKNKLAVTMSVFLIMAAIAITASAAPGAGKGGGMGQGAGQEMVLLTMLSRAVDNPQVRQALNLTDTQVKSIKAKLTPNALDMLKNAKQSQAQAEKQLVEMLTADDADTREVDAKIDEIAKISTQSRKQLAHLLIDVKNILTPDQRAKIKQFVESKKAQRGKGGAGRRGGRFSGGGGQGAEQ